VKVIIRYSVAPTIAPHTIHCAVFSAKLTYPVSVATNATSTASHTTSATIASRLLRAGFSGSGCAAALSRPSATSTPAISARWSSAISAFAAVDAAALAPTSALAVISSWPKNTNPAAAQVKGRSVCAALSPIGNSRQLGCARNSNAPPNADRKAAKNDNPTKRAAIWSNAGDSRADQRSDWTNASAANPGNIVPITTSHSA